MMNPTMLIMPCFTLLPSGGMASGDWCTGCACDNEQEEPFYLTFGNSWNLGWYKEL